MSKKLKLLSIFVGAVSSLQMILPISVFAADPKEQNENNIASGTTQDFSIPGIDEQNVNQLNEDGYAPLHLQIQEDNLGTVEFLISKGADVSLRDKNGDTPLHTAAREDAIECLSYLISKGADVEVKNSQGETPLMLAAKAGNRLSFSALLGDWLKEKRANINAVDDDNNTILHCLAGSWMGQLDSLLQHICHCSEEDPCASLCEMINRKNNAGETPLFNAIRSKNEEVAMLLIKNGAKSDDKNNKGQTPLMLAGEYGLKNLVKELSRLDGNVKNKDDEGNTLLHYMAHNWDSSLNNVFSDPIDAKYNDKSFLQLREMINAANENGKTPLFIAAENNQSELAKLLIENGSNVNCLSTVDIHTKYNTSYQSNFTPLHIAAEKNNFEVAKVLIENGAQVNFKNMDRETPIHIATRNNSLEVAMLLIENGALNISDKDGQTPLMLAVQEGLEDLVIKFIDQGMNIEAKDKDGNTFLHYMAMYGGDSLVRIFSNSIGFEYKNSSFLKLRKIINATDKHGCTPLIIAVSYSELLAEFLIKSGADVNIADKHGNTPILNAIHQNRYELTKLLVANGASLNINANARHLLAEDAGTFWGFEVVKLLFDNGFRFDAQDCDVALFFAVNNNAFQLAKFLIENGADVNFEGRSFWSRQRLTPIYVAVVNNSFQLAKLLIENGADVSFKDSNQKTLLHLAAKSYNFKMAKNLIENGINIEAENSKEGPRPFYISMSINSFDIVELLIQRGADVNVKDSDGKTPLHEAAGRGNFEVSKLLIESGAAVNAKSLNGITPLHSAVVSGNSEVPKLLIENGADVNAKDNKGQTSLDLATDPQIRSLIEEAISK